MRKSLLLMLMLYLAGSLSAQDISDVNLKHYPGKVKYLKTEQDATIFELPYPKDQVEENMRKLAEKRGVKVKERNGFYEARNVTILRLNEKAFDMYYKVEKDGKAASKVYMILAEPGESLDNRQSSHAALLLAAGGVGVAAAMGSSMGEHDHDLKTRQQEKEIKDAEKKYNSLMEEQKKLEKRMTDLQKDLEKNKTDQARLQSDIESRKKALDAFKSGKPKADDVKGKQ